MGDADRKRRKLQVKIERSRVLVSKSTEETRVQAGATIQEAFLSGRLRQVLKEVSDESLDSGAASSKADICSADEQVRSGRTVVPRQLFSCSKRFRLPWRCTKP